MEEKAFAHPHFAILLRFFFHLHVVFTFLGVESREFWQMCNFHDIQGSEQLSHPRRFSRAASLVTSSPPAPGSCRSASTMSGMGTHGVGLFESSLSLSTVCWRFIQVAAGTRVCFLMFLECSTVWVGQSLQLSPCTCWRTFGFYTSNE